MLIRHPNSARGNDLYEMREVATLALLTREPLSPTIWEIDADALCMPEGWQEVRSAQARLDGIWKFRKDMKRQRRGEAAQAAAPEAVPAPPPRDSLSEQRGAANRRRVAVQ
jgi:hypothetical protein